MYAFSQWFPQDVVREHGTSEVLAGLLGLVQTQSPFPSCLSGGGYGELGLRATAWTTLDSS